MTRVILTMELRHEQDLVLCRQRVRRIAELLAFDRQEQTRIATAVSEIVRNAFEYAGGGRVEIGLGEQAHPLFMVTIRDSGPGIAELKAVLGGSYISKSGLGLGILGAKRLMEHFEIVSKPGQGTQVSLGKPVPHASLPISVRKFGEIADKLAQDVVQDPLHEMRQQNQELLRALETLQARQSELAELNRELEETNRGVVALYAELDEKADSLRRASEAKTSFLSNMTHEFRTPLNSILGLSRAALSGEDGGLAPEHRKQVTYIQKSAEALSELVNDLLDIAKVEAGKVEVRPTEFDLRDLMGGLRGVLKPLSAARPEVALVFDEVEENLHLRTDEGKLAQILRNLVSNALKYTEAGHVQVSAERSSDGSIRFTVSDTGIGIAPENQERIFEEFVQIESPLQRGSKGTGLGLPLSRRLAKLLGGELVVRSRLGEGSVFTLSFPPEAVLVAQDLEAPAEPPGLRSVGPSDLSSPLSEVLVIDDEEISRYLLRDLLPRDRFTLLEAADGFEGIRIAAKESPSLIFLDLQMPAMSGFYVLELLKSNPLTRAIPVIVHTAMTLTEKEKRKLVGEVVAIVPKEAASREMTRAQIREAILRAGISLSDDTKEAWSG